MTVGYTNPGYPVLRTILNRCEGVDYVRVRSFDSLFVKILQKSHLPRVGLMRTGCTYWGGFSTRRVDLFHFFNLLAGGFCGKPFVTTFETSVPRELREGDYWFKKGLEALVSSRCRALLALSECSRRIQMEVLQRHLSSDECRCVERKMSVLHPPQAPLLDEGEMKTLTATRLERSGPMKFAFVGKDFFRKGGVEVLRALHRIRRDRAVELWIVGDVSRGGYATSSEVDRPEETLRLINENSSWVHWCRALPNSEVLSLFKKCDVGLLPTRADTYGYSVLEMQACGLPVVTTDVRALPEINDEACGWIVGVERDERGEALYGNVDQIRRLSTMVEEGLYRQLCALDRRTVVEKGVKAYRRILESHSPREYSRKLGQVYLDALARA